MFDERRKRVVEKACSQMIKNNKPRVFPANHPFDSCGAESLNAMRDHFANYFMEEGAVSFQWDKAINNDF